MDRSASPSNDTGEPDRGKAHAAARVAATEAQRFLTDENRLLMPATGPERTYGPSPIESAAVGEIAVLNRSRALRPPISKTAGGPGPMVAAQMLLLEFHLPTCLDPDTQYGLPTLDPRGNGKRQRRACTSLDYDGAKP
jgi:hypothetical protein